MKVIGLHAKEVEKINKRPTPKTSKQTNKQQQRKNTCWKKGKKDATNQKKKVRKERRKNNYNQPIKNKQRKSSWLWTPWLIFFIRSHQQSAWGTAEARQENGIVEVVRKGFVIGKCWSMCWTHLQMFSVSTVLGDKASDVEQSWGPSAKLLAVAQQYVGHEEDR